MRGCSILGVDDDGDPGWRPSIRYQTFDQGGGFTPGKVWSGPVGKVRQRISGFGEHLVDYGSGMAVQAEPSFEPGFVQVGLHHQKPVRSRPVFIVRGDPDLLGGTPSHPGHIHMLEKTDIIGDTRQRLDTIKGGLT